MRVLEKLKPLALLLLRWGLAAIYIFHGYPKLFTHTAQFLESFPRMGFPSYFVYIVGVVEFFGGVLLIAGLFTRLVGLLLAGEMAIAIFKVHMTHGILAVNTYEFPLACGVAAFALMALGAGSVSVDYLIFKGRA